MNKIIHITTGLKKAGAETILYELIKNDNKNNHLVISLSLGGFYGDELIKLGIKVYWINFSFKNIFSNLIQINDIIRNEKPEIIQTWMYHANIIGGIIAYFAKVKIIIWCLHAGSIKTLGLSAKFFAIIGVPFSYFIPSSIICVAKKTVDEHINWGYLKKRLVLIHNGLDTNVFNSDNQLFKKELMKKWNFNNKTILIGCIARWDKHKDHYTLLKSLGLLVKNNYSNFKLCLLGEGVSEKNNQLTKLIKEFNLGTKVILIGFKANIQSFYSSFDICVLPSLSEAFPMVLLESMACKVPCISSNAGDANLIIQDTGWIYPIGDADCLSKSFEKAFSEIKNFKRWQNKKEKCRIRIKENFSLDLMVKSYQNVWSCKI